MFAFFLFSLFPKGEERPGTILDGRLNCWG